MSRVPPAKPRAAPASPREPVVYTRYWVPAAWVKLGMYVADLDRPWLDTPFMLQGFLVSTPQQVAALQKHCQRVIVDVEASLDELVPAILERGEPFVAEVREVSPHDFGNAWVRPLRAFEGEETASYRKAGGPVGPRVTVTPDESASRGRRGSGPNPAPQGPADGRRVRTASKATARTGDANETPARTSTARPGPGKAGGNGFWGWLRALMGGRTRASRPTVSPRLPPALEREIRAVLPPNARLQDWPERRSTQSEMPRARAAFARGEKELIGVFRELQGGRLPGIESVQRAMSDVVASMIDNPNAMLWVAQLRHNHARSYRHALRVALYLVALGRQLGLPRPHLVELSMVGLLADIGKVRLPSELLDRPGMLTPEEFETVKGHVQSSMDLIAETPGLAEEVRKGIAQHHERMDGSGYPAGLRDTQISIYGRMAAIADCFSALTTHRPYAEPDTPHQAIMRLFDWSPSGLHAPLVEQFVQSIGVFPVGSLVELSSGEAAVVLAHNRVRRLEPRVLLLTTPDKRHLETPVELDLMNQSLDEDQSPVHILRGLPQGAHGLSPRDYYADTAQEQAVAA